MKGKNKEKENFIEHFEKLEKNQAERILISIIQNIPDAVCAIDLDEKIISWNKGAERMLEYKSDEIIGKPLLSIIPEDLGQEAVDECIEALNREGAFSEKESERVTKSGKRKTVELAAVALKDKKDSIIGYASIMRDITRRKETEKALKEGEEKFRALFENAPDIVWLHDLEGNIIMCNARASRKLGYSVEELESMNISEIVPQNMDIKEKINEIVEKKRTRFESRHRGRDGISYDVEVHAVTTKYGGKEVVLSYVRDITTWKKTEEVLKKYAGELQESNKLKDLFSDIISHDLLNHLFIVKGYTDILIQEEKCTENRDFLKNIMKNLDSSERIIGNAIRLSKLEFGGDIEFEYYDLKKVLELTVKNLSPLAASEGMEIENRIKKSMPFKANQIIQEAFSNLISNAVKYASEGGKVIISGEEDKKSWRVKIIDFGPGIEDENKERVFERFKRKNKRGIKGSGLGLAITKRIVELHGGNIWVEDNTIEYSDEQGRTRTKVCGSIFYVKLPKS